MRYRISPDDTLAPVPSGDRKYDEDCATHARDLLREWVREHGGQTKAAKKLGVHQSTVLRSLDPKSQPTLKVLIPLAEKMHLSLDQVLGLRPRPPPPPVIRITDSEVLRVAEHVAKQVVRKLTPKGMPAVRAPLRLAPKLEEPKAGNPKPEEPSPPPSAPSIADGENAQGPANPADSDESPKRRARRPEDDE